MHRYMGPYYKFFVQQVEKQKTETFCPKCDECKYSAFCSVCGTATEKRVVKIKEDKVSYMQLTDDLGIVDRFAVCHIPIGRTRFDVWIPNQKVPGITRDKYFNDDEGIQEPPDDVNAMIQAEKDAFKAEYGKDILGVAKAYGQPANVLWGLLGYYDR